MRELGTGRAARVVEAVDVAGARVALRLLHPWLVKKDWSASPSTQRPLDAPSVSPDRLTVLRARRVLRHEHVIPIFDVGEAADGTLYLASAFVEATRVDAVCGRGRMPWRRALDILVQLCGALEVAHVRGIVLRKLRPSKLYLEARQTRPEGSGEPYRGAHEATDFVLLDVASIDPPDEFVLEDQRDRMVEVDGLSPELIMGRPADGRSDIYALGLLAYELISGQHAFPDTRSLAHMIGAQLKMTPMPLSSYERSVPRALDAVIAQCLAKNPNDRPRDVGQLRDELSALKVA